MNIHAVPLIDFMSGPLPALCQNTQYMAVEGLFLYEPSLAGCPLDAECWSMARPDVRCDASHGTWSLYLILSFTDS